MNIAPTTHPFWVRYEPKGNLAELLDITAGAELAHRRLCDTVWATHRWPKVGDKSTIQVARCTAKRWPNVLQELRKLGWHNHRQRLLNHAVAATLNEAKQYQQLNATRASRAANARWSEKQKLLLEPEKTPPAPRSTEPVPGHAPSIAASIAPAMPVQNSTEQHSLALNKAERLTCSASARKSDATAEKDFIGEVKLHMTTFSPKQARQEMDNWGGWWRNRFRENPAKARKVLAEIASMIREKRILMNPGAAASDLWKRLP
ncbi:MAG: hypothetical protein NT154_12015 [Verrucomicrobia bacterium]|nr:hypothetical protein [Verrucomicrobiota bacterium]